MASHLFDPSISVPAAATVAGADAAIARVLASERDARAAVADCARSAEREVQQARDRARLIAARGAERSARVHAAIERRLAQRLAEIGAQRSALAAGAVDIRADAAGLAAAAGRLAAELTHASATAASGTRD